MSPEADGPRSGFENSHEVSQEYLRLSGRHRFSRYWLVFALGDDVDGTTVVSARTFADFPGRLGRAYRGLVIGSRIHVLAVRRTGPRPPPRETRHE